MLLKWAAIFFIIATACAYVCELTKERRCRGLGSPRSATPAVVQVFQCHVMRLE